MSGSYIKEEKKDIETFMRYSRPPEVFTVFSFNQDLFRAFQWLHPEPF